MTGKRKRYSAEFKAHVVLDALQGELTTARLATKHGIHQCDGGRVEEAGHGKHGGGVLLRNAEHWRMARPSEAEVEELHATIGQLVVEQDFWRKHPVDVPGAEAADGAKLRFLRDRAGASQPVRGAPVRAGVNQPVGVLPPACGRATAELPGWVVAGPATIAWRLRWATAARASASTSGTWAHGLRFLPSRMRCRSPAWIGSTRTAAKSSGSGPGSRNGAPSPRAAGKPQTPSWTSFAWPQPSIGSNANRP